MSQGKIDFGLSAHRRRILDRLPGILVEELRLSPRGVAAWLLLAVLEDLFLRTNKGTAPSVTTTQPEMRARIVRRLRDKSASRTRLGVRQLGTAVSALKQFGWIGVDQRKWRLKSLPAVYRIEWPAIEAFVTVPQAEPLPNVSARRGHLQPAVFRSTAGSFLLSENQNCRPDLDPSSNVDPPPSKREAGWHPGKWREVEESLVGAGIGDWSRLVDVVAANGCAPSEVLEILRHAAARPGAWGPGALHHRIRSQLPGRPVSEGWPAPSEEYARKERQRAERQRLAGEHEKRREASSGSAELREKLLDDRGRREAEFGATLDSMSKEERNRLAASLPPTLLKLYRSSGVSIRWVRDALLDLLQQAGRPPPPEQEVAG
jgi:hypothetical protein